MKISLIKGQCETVSPRFYWIKPMKRATEMPIKCQLLPRLLRDFHCVEWKGIYYYILFYLQISVQFTNSTEKNLLLCNSTGLFITIVCQVFTPTKCGERKAAATRIKRCELYNYKTIHYKARQWRPPFIHNGGLFHCNRWRCEER